MIFRICQGLATVDSNVQVHLPLPGSGNQTRHNRPSKLLGCHTSVDIHLAMCDNGVTLCDTDSNEP